jgi:hypothetical protein
MSKNNILIVAVITFILSFLFVGKNTVKAQSAQLADLNVKVTCLTVTDPKGTSRTGMYDDLSTDNSKVYYRENIGLKGTFNSTTGTVVYAIACRGSGTGRTCSSGNSAINQFLFKDMVNVAEELQVRVGGDVIFKPGARQTSGASGDNAIDGVVNTGEPTIQSDGVFTVIGNVEAEPDFSKPLITFYGVELTSPNLASGQGAESGNEGGLGQGTLDFEKLLSDEASKKCVPISWINIDPYGIVFDSQTLEPIENAQIIVYNEFGIPLSQGAKNTLYDGIYNYLVKPGKYTISVSAPGYIFSAKPKTNSSLTKIYDFIDENSTQSHCTIYRPGEIINEKAGLPECRNIPLDSISSSPRKDIIKMDYEYLPDYIDNFHVVRGRVSHALSKIVAYQTINQSQRIDIASTEANHFGFFNLEIPVDKIFSKTEIKIEFIKSSLMTGEAQLTYDKNIDTISINPAPKYLEGYAIDHTQTILPNATIKIKLKNGNSTYAQLKTDNNGYFFIPNNRLPSSGVNLEYALELISKNGSTTKLTISDFIARNEYFLTRENINLLKGTKNGKKPYPQPSLSTKLDLTTLSKENNQLREKGTNEGGSLRNTDSSSLSSNTDNIQLLKNGSITQQVIIIIFALLLLGVVGGIILVGLLKKKKSF